jgi:hypothetical protein
MVAIPVYKRIAPVIHHAWKSDRYISLPASKTLNINPCFVSFGTDGHTLPARINPVAILASNIVAVCYYGLHFKIGKGVFSEAGLRKNESMALLLSPNAAVGITYPPDPIPQSAKNLVPWQNISVNNINAGMGYQHIVCTRDAFTQALNGPAAELEIPGGGSMSTYEKNEFNNLPPIAIVQQQQQELQKKQ